MTTASESAVRRPLERMLRGARALGFATRASVFRMSTDPIWTENALADLRREFGDAYAGRTVLVTGADGFMGSHLTDALVEIGADVHAFVRATSSGALNNISHLRNRLKVKFADLTDKTSIDYLIKELRDTVSDKPYVFHLGAQAHVGESWHRPYETVMANTIGTLNLLQSVVDWGLELEKFDTAGTSEEYGNVRENVAHHHDFDEAGGLILHERSPINPKSIYATAKVAADFLTMNYHDAFGVPGVVTRMFNNYGPRQNPRYVTGTIITQALTRPEIELGALEPLRDFCFCTDGVRGHLTVAAKGVPGDVYVYGQGSNISMADWADLILRTGVEHGFWPDDRHIVIDEGRLRPGVTDVMALARRLREAEPRDRLGAEGVVGGRRPADDPVVRRAPRALDRPRRLAADRRHCPRDVSRVLVTGRRRLRRLAPRRTARGRLGTTCSSARRRDYDLTSMDDTARLFADAKPELVFHLAAEVGGIGANRANPGRYWYANLVMGAHVLEQSRLHDVAQARRRRHRLRLSEAHARSVPRGRPLGRLPGGDERPVRGREEGGARGRSGVPRAVRAQHRLPAAREPLRTARQLRPRELARDPGADPEDARLEGRSRAVGRRLADPRVPLRRRLRQRPRPRCGALRRRRACEPRHRSRDADPGAGGDRSPM